MVPKGQVSIEFLASTFIFLIGVGGALTFIGAELPDFRDSVRSSSVNLDATKMSNRLLTQPGTHSMGGTEWEKNSSTRSSITSFGFASDYLILEEDKVQAVSTVGSNANYSRFQQVESPEYQYNLVFTWFPLVHTSNGFEKGSPPSQPPIVEPNTQSYQDSRGSIQYGSTRLHGTDYRFLTTAHLGQYDTVYVSTDWNFASGVQGPLSAGDVFDIAGEEFTVNSFQNRGNDDGELVTLSKEVKEFGASPPQSSESIKINRYGVYNASDSEDHPVRIEVLAW